MRRPLSDAPEIHGAADLERRRDFRWTVPYTGLPKRCALLAVYRPPRLTACGLCGCLNHTMFLARFFAGPETVLGESCCSHRFPDWKQQEAAAWALDELTDERAVIRRTAAERDMHLETAYSMVGEARRLRDAKFDFQSAYPDYLVARLISAAGGEEPAVIDGVEIWKADAWSTLQSSIETIKALDSIAYADDPDLDADPSAYIRHTALLCERLPATFASAADVLAAGPRFFAPANLERLPELLEPGAERAEVHRITAGLRARRA